MLCEVLEMSIGFNDASISLSLISDATQRRVPVSRKWFTRRDTVDLFVTENYGNVPLTSFSQVSKNDTPCVGDNETH